MSRQQLAALVARDALRPRMQFAELAGDHVSLDAITGQAAYESVVLRELARDDAVRVSVVGPRGAGKTSLIAYCCRHLPGQVIALRVPVVAMDDPGDPRVVADVAIAAALAAGKFDVHEAAALDRARADEIVTAARDPSLRARIGGGVVPVELEGELTSYGQEYLRRGQALDRLQGLDRLIGMYLRRGLRPIFVVEDTEAMAGTPDSDELVTRFFARSLNALARELDAGIVVAVQEHLRENVAYGELAAGMREVQLPLLADPAAGLRRILEHRLARVEFAAKVEDVIDAPALHAFGRMYVDEEANLRRTLAAITVSVEHAADVGAERVGEAEARFGIQSGA